MSRNSASIAHFTESEDGGLHQVVGVRRTLRLSEDVLDSDAIEDGAHSTTGNDSGTF